MGVFLGQLPPAELARLKAELAETLIANFCYPRFYDYRTESLRMRPVDRAKRQEVWLYLSSVDFTAWSRIDLMSVEMQNFIERLFIHFVQRNRAFFGNQGRKRMTDVKMLINSSAQAVTEGLRGHLSGQGTKKPAFGSPRQVPSWSMLNAVGFVEPGWERIAQPTLTLQQQLQELRGESRPAVAPGGRRSSAQTPSVQPAAATRSNIATDGRQRATQAPPPNGTAWPSAAPMTPSTRKSGQMPVAPAAAVTTAPPGVNARPAVHRTPVVEPPSTWSATPELPGASVPSAPPLAARGTSMVSQPTGMDLMNGQHEEGAGMMAHNEDLTIFEEMRYQLIVWLRVEAVRQGLDISGQSPAQLLELLRHQDSFDQTRLQVISTLLNLIAQVVKNGKASIMDYKQGLMFYLMHTRRA